MKNDDRNKTRKYFYTRQRNTKNMRVLIVEKNTQDSVAKLSYIDIYILLVY